MAQSNGVIAWVMFAGVTFAAAASATHPLQTEDTGTQGEGNVEIENGLSWLSTGGSKTFTYQPQVSYGLSPTIDLIVQPSWLSIVDEGGPTARGWGVTNCDAKWRFFGEAPLSFAVRAGATLATNPLGLDNAHGRWWSHAVVVTTYDAAPFTLHGNLGLTQLPSGTGGRSRIGQVSGALMWAANEQLTLTVDGGASTSPDPLRSSWPGTLLVGAVYTIWSGLDVDLGYQSSVRSEVSFRQWLLGLTYRFGL